MSDKDLVQIFPDVPSAESTRSDLEGEGIGLMDAFVHVGLAKSKGEARRTIQGGGGYVNNIRVEDIDHKLTAADLASESVIVLRSGKKKFGLLKFA